MHFMPMHIKIDRQDDVCVLRIKGSILPGTDSDYLRRKQDEIVERNCHKVLADFREVPSIGSTGLNFVLSVFDNCGGRFVLAAPNALVRKVLDLTRLSGVIPIAADLASGLAVLRTLQEVAEKRPHRQGVETFTTMPCKRVATAASVVMTTEAPAAITDGIVHTENSIGAQIRRPLLWRLRMRPMPSS